ncbi:MAG: DEAD/DEAH box helicase [Anaerolineales bacterium]|nr:DEAD/DEAH box helicase [Anaerolineales bacterium]
MILSDRDLDLISNEVLSRIEIREARLLNWGFIQGLQPLDWLDEELPVILDSLSPQLKSKAYHADGITYVDIIRNLEDRKLIFNNGKGIYRSRFAETIRLMYLLRQRFSDEDWNTGARLVSDMKIFLRRRRFPNWNIDVEDVLNNITSLTQLQKNIIRLLTQGDQLARFQSDAIRQQLHSLRENTDSAIVVGAGTGSGKTRAFYIPALTHIAQTKTEKFVVHALALYPRVELLKDQFREIYREARKLDTLLNEIGISPIRIGAYYNSVIRSASDFGNLQLMYERNWRRTKEDNGWICPYMICPQCGRGALAWFDQEIDKEKAKNTQGIYGDHEVLKCLSCNEIISGDVFPITRAHLLAKPPDILFTTTETLNRRLGDPSEHHLFGIRVQEPPRLLLMDEIHLNEGFHGSQVAYLLRRWRYARGSKTGLCVVGLSATLTQADIFFSRLTGISNVSYITPSENDMIDEGLEYNVVLKGDPVSGTTLLSTSVRTIMLLGRTLDSFSKESVSRGAWGQRIFAFSDKLDSINRWYHILKEVENPRQPYAQWRLLDPKKVSRETWQSRNQMGQNWWVASQINPDALSTGLFLDLTSSQYRGVDPNADVIVASSTLEVGYNDPKVGAVVQHKSPYGHASFLQRKGRAGRPRNMRPWMVVVTSSYGRDRWAFQHAESLFDSVLPPMDLPLENYYVRKVQAVYALLDWLAVKLQTLGYISNIWTLLGSGTPYQRNSRHEDARKQLYRLLITLLNEDELRNEAIEYIQDALGIIEDHILKLLFWGKPRSIMLDVVPTMIRQLDSNWGTVLLEDGSWSFNEWTDNTSELPLPEFLPASLFSDLNLPEVLIQVPKRPQYRDAEREIRAKEMLGLTLGMLEFTPGKVNKRFADKDHTSEAHWIPVPEVQVASNYVDIRDMSIQFASQPHILHFEDRTISVCRPEIFDLHIVPHNIRPTSNAFHRWSSHFLPRERRFESSTNHDAAIGQRIYLDNDSNWNRIFDDLRVFTHTKGSWAEVTRFAETTEVYTRFDHGGEQRRIISYILDNDPAAMGFTIDVDALHFTVAPLNTNELKKHANWTLIYGQLSSLFYRHKLYQDLGYLTDFEVEWLWQVQMSMLIERAATLEISLEDAREVVHADIVSLSKRNLHILLENSAINDEDMNTPEENILLIDNLVRLLSNSEVTNILYSNLQVLWDDNDVEIDVYLNELYIHSLGALTFSAIIDMFPEVDADDLHLDVKQNSFWISELTAGGVGFISRIADDIELSPHRFEAFLRHTMTFCEREYLAEQMNATAQLTSRHDLTSQFNEIRKVTDLPRVEQLQKALSATLQKSGIVPNRNLLVSINTRFLRPNSDTDSDTLIRDLINFWKEQEARLGCVIDLRVIATAATQQPYIRLQVQNILKRINNSEDDFNDAQVFNLLQSFLWINCKDSCPDCIEKNHRYQQNLHPSRHLLLAVTTFEVETIVFGTREWEVEVNEALINKQVVTIECKYDEVRQAQQELIGWLTKPIDVGYIVSYPTLSRVERTNDRILFELTLSELVEAF